MFSVKKVLINEMWADHCPKCNIWRKTRDDDRSCCSLNEQDTGSLKNLLLFYPTLSREFIIRPATQQNECSKHRLSLPTVIGSSPFDAFQWRNPDFPAMFLRVQAQIAKKEKEKEEQKQRQQQQ